MESTPITPDRDAGSNRYYEPNTALNRLLLEAPYLPRCSDNKTAALVRPREYAIRYPYMQVNRSDMVSWLVFDLDHSNPLIWEDENLPPPNFVVRNPKNGHSHLFYAIAPVCTSENARSKPINFMKAVYDAMAERLAADPSYSGPVAKTPGHPWWSTRENHAHEYDLGELAEYVDLVVKPLWSAGPDLDAASHSRHCLLFEELRFYAYSIVSRERANGSYKNFLRFVEAFAFNKNNYQQRGFSMNLTASQVKATVKSVARWTWDRYTGGSQCHRGVMSLDPSLPLRDRQQLAARRTHKARNKASESKIRAACQALLKEGARLTLVSIAGLSGLARQTVAKYRHLITEAKPTPKAVLLQPLKPSPEDVTYAVHQIPVVTDSGLVGAVWGLFCLLSGCYVNFILDPPV